MKTLLLLGAAALSLTGCSSGGKCDTSDTACEGGGGGGGAPIIQAFDGDCAGSTCTWWVEATGELGNVELDLTETGDPTSTCGPSSTKSLNECGVWNEFHDSFTLSDFTDSTETKSIELQLVDDYTQQVNNESTLFDVSDGTISSQLTILFTVYDSNGAYSDCAVSGDDVSYYASECTNNADLW
jgi:hypothetical protein